MLRKNYDRVRTEEEIINLESQELLIPERKKTRLYWADCLRIFSMLNIIFLHSANYAFEKSLSNEKSPDLFYVCVYNSITRFSVPVFVVISGTFFLNPDKPFSFKKLFKRNILRLFTAYYFWSFTNAFINIIKSKRRPIFSQENFKIFMGNFIVGEEYLWFILMITGCYLCVPFLRLFSNDEFLSKYFLGLWFFWGSLVPSVKSILKFVHYDGLNNGFTVWTDRWHFTFTIEFIGYFVLGYFILKHVNIESLKKRIILYILCVIDVIFYTSLTYYAEKRDGGYSNQFRGNMSIFVVFYSFVLVIFFKHEIGRIEFSERAVKIITKLSSLSFGMYLCHMIVRNTFMIFIRQNKIGDMHYSTLFGVPLLFILTSSFSFLVSYGISFIPKLRNYII